VVQRRTFVYLKTTQSTNHDHLPSTNDRSGKRTWKKRCISAASCANSRWNWPRNAGHDRRISRWVPVPHALGFAVALAALSSAQVPITSGNSKSIFPGHGRAAELARKTRRGNKMGVSRVLLRLSRNHRSKRGWLGRSASPIWAAAQVSSVGGNGDQRRASSADTPLVRSFSACWSGGGLAVPSGRHDLWSWRGRAGAGGVFEPAPARSAEALARKPCFFQLVPIFLLPELTGTTRSSGTDKGVQ
jgi:hypothetical protein